MIKIVAKNYVKPECANTFIAAVKPLIKGSREEEGNVFYTLNRSKKEPNTFAFIECWKNEEAIAFHNQTEHFTSIVPKLAEFCEKPGEVELFDEVE